MQTVCNDNCKTSHLLTVRAETYTLHEHLQIAMLNLTDMTSSGKVTSLYYHATEQGRFCKPGQIQPLTFSVLFMDSELRHDR